MLKVSFDPENKIIRIVEPPFQGSTILDVRRDLYSAAKYHWLTDPLANKFTFPFTVIGGNDLGGGLTAGTYYFLRTDLGWQIQPFEDNHELQLTGNIYPFDAEDVLFTPAPNGATVTIRLERSQLTQTIAVEQGTTQATNRLEADSFLAGSVFISSTRGEQGTVFPIGTPSAPSNNINDAIVIAQSLNFNSFIVEGEITLTDDTPTRSDWKGLGPIRSNIIFDGSPDRSEFTKMVVGGRMSSLGIFEECSIRDIEDFDGVVKQSFIAGQLTVASDALACQFFDCKTIDIREEFDPTASPAVIDLINYAGPVILRGYTGPIRITNLVNGNRVSVDMYSGSVYLDSSCTTGRVDIGGVCRVWDESGENCIVEELHVETQRMKELWQRFGLDPANPMTSTRTTVTFDGITVDITGDGVNSSTVTRRP